MTKKTEIYCRRQNLFLLFILIMSAFLRFYQLGYSHFYGDEIKTLYLRKDVSAFNFLMNQRKGPVQFVTSWVAEKISGGYDELWIRLPYAAAGTLLVYIFYYFVRQNFGIAPALYSSLFFSLSGFNIAFSRTAQYQVWYLLFGFLCLILAKTYADKGKLCVLAASAGCLSLALLSHYDAVFFLIPLYFIINKKTFFKIALLGLAFTSLFYIPNIYSGFFESNTFGYISKRLSGLVYQKNNSLYTIFVYNPLYVYPLALLVLSIVGLKNAKAEHKNLLLAWFFIPFAIFQLLILNPGTHINNYLIPLSILAGLGASYLLNSSVKYKPYVFLTFTTLLGLICAIQIWTYIPGVNAGYPWKEARLFGITTQRVGDDYQLYLYGFPYRRGWDKIGQYMNTVKGVRNFYTNDNEVVAEYYLNIAPYTAPGSNFLPQYYIQIDNPQELKQKPEIPLVDQYNVILESGIGEVKIFKLKPVEVKIGAKAAL